jgi:hypothetical protein
MSTGDASATRRNQLLVREVNRRILELTNSSEAHEALELLCECGDAECIISFALPAEEADRLVSQAGGALIAADHRASVDASRVIAGNGAWCLVAH